ncbi:unnamed protein product [Rotaria magnacalcarata]|uniref:TFIID subunit TAF5 NTD2 domain-containing protein n=1 Tax=Rotaria magnacalcarata TaxID=392030 RepID=A0A819JE37_9BILA|nr:unnamed protein product [Rotaria magnacalcarata]CAF2157329.1 unnamed protein product [Rotaria magnacalcarata]CAF3932087.1 unnamed protein product [Rotaria magnacalcarata]CAF3998290.1 unnamed protein product [Rotaria magnacalcarata]
MENTNESQDSPDIAELIRFLQKNNLKKTELCFRREYDSRSNQISSVNVNDYFAVYSCLSNFILNSSYQLELIQCLFPLFVHLYLDLIEYNSTDECQRFYNQFVDSTFESLHREFFSQLKLISHSSKHLYQCSLTNVFRKSRFFLRLSMTSYNELQNFIDSTKSLTNFDLTSSQISLLLSIFQQYIKIDIDQQFFTPSNIVRFQTIEQPMTPIFVHMTVANTIQFTRLYTGMFPLQSSGIIETEQKRDLSSLYPQMNYNRLPNNIDLNNIPRLGPHKLPSICLYSLKNSKQTINCVTLSNDCRLLAVGFQSSEILICSLNPNHKLYSMKSATELHHSNNINILDTKSDLDKTNERLLIGHTGSILALAFEPNKQIYLLSGSQDCTIRLWHLSTWSCLVVYKMHFQCILDVTFASNGHTFASCSIDGLVCLWTIDKISPFRIYPEYGHSGPINLVEFHPNANYLASAHCDHTIHLWNIHHENSLVRIFNGHRHQISSLRFSPNGHFLASGCWNGEIILWDIQNNLQIAHLSLHKQAISSIEFNPLTGTLLLVASIDSSISLWNCFMITKLYDEKLADSINSPSSSSSSSSNKILLNLFKTKNTSLFHIRFSKENVLYAIGLIGSTNK